MVSTVEGEIQLGPVEDLDMSNFKKIAADLTVGNILKLTMLDRSTGIPQKPSEV